MTTVSLSGTIKTKAALPGLFTTIHLTGTARTGSKTLANPKFRIGLAATAAARGSVNTLTIVGMAANKGRAALAEAADVLTGSGTLSPLPAATGSAADLVSRVKRLIPKGWFAYTAPVREAVLGGLADAASWCYGLIYYAKAQTRIATSSGIWLDLTALDFFGTALKRGNGQSDAAFKARIQAELLQERVTRKGMVEVITALTGAPPTIFEPWNTGDAGAWDTGTFAWDAAGGWGDTCLPSQAFMVVTRPGVQGVPNVSGWDGGAGAWDAGAVEWTDPSQITGAVTDQDIYDAINHTRPTGSLIWTRLQ